MQCNNLESNSHKNCAAMRQFEMHKNEIDSSNTYKGRMLNKSQRPEDCYKGFTWGK